MSIIDIITVIFIFIMAIMGVRTGFVKSALGTVSVFVCGILTIFLYNYLADTGIVSGIEEAVFLHLEEKTVIGMRLFGVVDYIASGICMVAVFVVVRIGYRFFAGILDFVVPGFINKFLGGAFGFVKGVAVVLCVLAVMYYVNGSVPEFVEKIDDTTIVSACYHNNPLIAFFKKG